MNRRLFWKILIIFWGIFYLTFQLTWIGFSFYIQNRDAKTYYHIPTKVEMIAQLLQISGEREAVNFISHLPEPERLCFSITLSNAQDEHIKVVSNDLKDGSFIYQKTAIAPDGIIYLITFKDSNKNYSNGSIFNLPIPMFLMGITGGLLFSLFLAWNLTRPMKLLRQGFFRVSQGDLSVRLYEHLKLRHDELSELAKDFDSMVEQLDILITDRQVLLHDVSHELRTPLARLQLAIGLAQQNKQNIDNSLARIELESQRLDALIAEPQHIIINFSLEPIIHSIIKGISDQIRRAIENIIRNAIRFSQKEQQIDIHLKEVGKYLQVVVSDHGPGVDVHKLSSIFEPFVRIQSPQLGKGYGLGLAIARKSITMHNGSIQAKNRESRGLNMTIKLPYWRG